MVNSKFQLTKQSSDSEIKAYFIQVLNLSRSKEEFPVNLDEVWPLVYSRRDKAVRALRSGEIFMEGIDYQVPPPKMGKSLIHFPILGEKSKMMVKMKSRKAVLA